MAHKVIKISGSTQVKMIDIGDPGIRYIAMANIHDTDTAAVDLFLANSTDNYYIFKNLSIPAGQTLILEGNEITYDTRIYSLYIKLGASSSNVDVIIK